MQILATILSLTSGFAVMGYRLPPATILATSIVVDLALAPLTAIIAARRGRRASVWAVAGVAFGMWSLAAVLLVPAAAPARASRPEPPAYPPKSHAA
ncbi:MAG TPA: hypothetical protein VNF29_11350 [Candidatus Binataceae bacterium]|nr:hypothetical protein [Candidatus Binataceae bacterium]